MTSSTPLLEIKDVRIAYGKREVVSGISLSVPEGQAFGLVGLNGVGKTTLIKTILGLREYAHGSIAIQGRDRNHPDSKKLIAYLPERFDPPWFLSGMEFLRFSMSLYGASKTQDEIFASSTRLALDPDVLKNRVQTYSKGMRQKLGILATLLTGCPLLILDEPMSGLDPRARALVKDALLEAGKANRTVFLSSHILSDMNEICDMVGVVSDGRLIFYGTPEELRKEGGSDNMERAFLSVVDRQQKAA